MELRQAIQAFRNAEAAGDVEAASRLARFIDQNLNQQPQAEAPAPEEGVFASGISGFKRAGAGLETALGSIIDPEGAAQRGLQRQQELSAQYAPGASLEKVKQAYEQRGLLSAAGEAISQVPSALAEQLPNIAATLAGGKAGAMAGTAIAPGLGTVVGGLTGAALPSLVQLYSSNLVRQAETTPQDISRLSALGAAAPGAALEVASTFIPLGRTFIGKILGPEAEKMLARGTSASLEKAAKESVAGSIVRGGAVGALAEIPTEVTQQMLERLQAGLPLTTDDALAEYAEAAYGATLVGTPFGIAGRTAGRSGARAEFDRVQQEEAARLAVSEEELAQRFPDTLPGGFKIEQEELGREMGPQGYNIMAEGRDEPLYSVNTEEEANAKLESLTKIRAEERENLLKEEEKINSSIQKAQQNLERLEATEQTDTDEYRSLKAQLPTMMDESAQKIKDTYDKIEALSKPLAVAPFGEVERVNSQFKLFSPDNQQVGVFKTREQAEGAIEQSIGEDTFKQAKENQAAAKELYKTFVPQMRKFGLGDVGLNIVDRIENGAGGAYLDKLIRVSLEDSNPVQTMRHESLHALKDLGFFTPQQWKALEGRASKEWIDKYLKGQMAAGEDGQPLVRDGRNVTRYDLYKEMNLSDQDIIEEAIADAFGDYDKGAKPPPGMIAALFRKLKAFFAKLSQALRGAGFQSADDIFQAIERGKLKPAAKAKPEEVAPTAEERRSLRKSPKDVSGKIKPGKKQRTSEKTDEQLRSEQPAVRPSARGDQGVETARGAEPEPRRIAPLEGAPSVPGFSGPIPEIVDAAERYARQNGIPFKRQAEYVRVNPERAMRIAEAYAQMPHAPNDPAVRAAYKDLVSQTTAQYKALVDAGYKFWFMDMSKPDNQEYASTPWNAMRDLKDNKQMGVFPTNDGFGSNEDFSAEANPLLAETEFKWPIGGLDGELQPVLANDLFRAVHDAFGHGLEGAGFRADGEENAWQAHVLLFKGPAVGAITSETRGQNSWLNFGPYGEKNRTAKVEDTTFADQKTGLMPEWTWTEGRAGEEPKGISLGKKQPGASSFEGIHYGISKVDSLSGSKYGTGIRGAERRRLENSDDERIKKRVYFYVQKPDGTMPVPEAGLGGYIYTQKFDNVLAPGAEMSRLSREAAGDSNTFESLVVDAGYDGYAIPDMGMMVVLNHNVPVNYEGTRAERGGKYSLRRLDSKEFKDWLGKSKIVDKDGKPLVMYHGLAKDTTDFTRKTKRGAPIFLTDDPDFAQVFATDSYESVARNPEKYLSKEQIAGGVKRAIAAIKKDYGKDSLGKEMVESLQTGDLIDATPEAREYIQKELISLLPTGPHIMPVYVRAENPFDYDNPEHVTKVVFELNKTTDSNGRRLGVKMSKDIENGKWDAIEDGYVQDAIKALGFDSFYVEEQGRKNLAVYEPNQVKSATGNVGTYSRDSNDVRYSLRNVAFPTVKEAKEAAEAVEVPDTMEFKRYIAGNQWVDEDGKAKKFYHATTSNFFEFNEGVIYLSDTAEESEKWGRMAEDRLREQIYRALNKDEKLPFFQKAVDEAVSNDKITQAQGEKFMRDAGRKIPEFDGYDLIKKEMDEALLSLAPDRMKIMPLYARAVTPFDFRNKDHVQQVMGAYNYTQEMDRKIGDVAKQVNKEIGGAPTVNVENILDGLKGILAQGYPKVVERPDIIRTIRKLGFDGYITRRNRNAPLSYAVFKPEQVKSITGNLGEYSGESKDVRYSLKSFKSEDLPSNNKPYTLPENTLIFHGAHKNAAKKIEESGRVLLSYPGVKSSSGSLDEGGLIFFGGEKVATAFATQKADLLSIKAASERGEERLPGTVFETATDRPYRLMSRHHQLSKNEASVLNDALGIPDYKRLNAGDSANIAAYRAYTNSNKIKREQIVDSGQMASPWPVIFDSLGFDGFYDSVNAPAIALTANNGIRLVGEDGKLQKFSLPRIDPRIDARVDTITTAREQKGFAQRIVEAISPSTFSSLRQSFLNRYEQLGRYDKLLAEQMGGAALLADQSAESAALMSDLASGVAASAMGYGDRHGGIPVYRNGATVIDRNVKGLIASLAPLAKYGDPKVYQYYQFWAGAKRAERLKAEGRERVYTQNDFAYARLLQTQFPEFVDVQKDLIAFNDGIVKFMVDTEVLSPEMGQKYTENADYIPFYRQMDGEKTAGPNIFSAISGVRPPKKLKGSDAPLADFLETMVRNTQSSIQAGMKNAAANRAIKVVKAVGNVPGVALERLNAQETGPNIINVLERGKLVSYKTPDKLLVEAVGSLNMSELPFMGLISGPSNLLRNLVTKDPGFMLANLLRDSLSTYVTSGQNMMPIAGTMGNFAKALAKRSPGYEALLDAGVIGGYELSQNVEKSGEDLARDLDKKAGKKDPILMRPFTSLWSALETGTTASDAATRALVYERVLAETGNEAEALYRAVEVMNFNRKGNSPLIRILTAAVPFFNARLQGLDLFYRASTGNMNTNDAKAIQLKFWTRGATMMALSVMYYMMMADDEEYKKQEQETKDGNWLISSLGIRIPIPFEVGVLFKVMPERITAYALGNDTGKDLRESAVRNLVSTFAFNPIPQTVKPLVEAATNFNFFTMRPIVGQGMSDVAPEFQVGPGTSKVAEKIGGQLGISPMKVDQVLKGYTGTMGIYMVDTIDLVMEQFGDSTKANKRFEQLPIIKRFAVDPEARGTVTAYYELKDAVDTFTRTSNLLEKTAKPEEFLAYVKKNAGVFAVKDYVLDLEKEMKELREMRRTITSSSMDGEQKKNLLTTVGRAEQNLTSNIQTVKKLIASTQ